MPFLNDCLYLVIRLLSKKLGEPCLLGIDGERDRAVELELLELLLEPELERLLDLERDLDSDLLLDDDRLLLLCPELKQNHIFPIQYKLLLTKIVILKYL